MADKIPFGSMLPKTWASIHRRTDGGPTLTACFEVFLGALANAAKDAAGGGEPFHMPETIVFPASAPARWYQYRAAARGIVQRPSSSLTTENILRVFTDAADVADSD
eukprot:gene19285-6550_t